MTGQVIWNELVAVVIAIVPISIAVPAAAVFVPPPMVLAPAAFAGFPQLMARVIRLPAIPAMMLNGFVQLAVGFVDAPLAMIVVVSGVGPWRGGEREQSDKSCGRQQRPSPELSLSRKHGHLFSILTVFPGLDGVLVPLG